MSSLTPTGTPDRPRVDGGIQADRTPCSAEPTPCAPQGRCAHRTSRRTSRRPGTVERASRARRGRCPREARTLDEPQADRWLSYVDHRDYGLLLQTAFYTGMRLGELLGLRWRDVDLEEGLIVVRQQYDRVARD